MSNHRIHREKINLRFFNRYALAIFLLLTLFFHYFIDITAKKINQPITLSQPFLSHYAPEIIILIIIFLILVILLSLLTIKRIKHQLTHLYNSVNQEKAKSELFIASISTPIIITNHQGITTYINQSAEEALKINYHDVIGKNICSILAITDEYGKELQSDCHLFDQMLKTKIPLNISTFDSNSYLYCRVSNVILPVTLTFTPIVLSDNLEAVLGVFNNVEHLFEVNRLKTEFISLASHQLRTPIAKMRWMTEMLVDHRDQLPLEDATLSQSLYDTNIQLIELVNSLLNVSRFESGRIAVHPEPTNPGQLLQSVITTHSYLFSQKNQQLIVDIIPDLPNINLDPRLISEVFKNFLTNANKYTHEHGGINLRLYHDQNNLIFQISDNGSGIPESDQAKIFSKLYRADNARKQQTDGSGLGLYLAKQIIESSGGSIWFESKENIGTTFWFSLPLTGSLYKDGDVSLA